MKTDNLDRMKGGWFVGDFEPSLYKTQACEMAVKIYKAGDSEKRHHHKIATEITIIVQGIVEINGKRFQTGDIIIIEPGESCDFKVISDTITAVAKIPGAKNDKYLGEV